MQPLPWCSRNNMPYWKRYVSFQYFWGRYFVFLWCCWCYTSMMFSNVFLNYTPITRIGRSNDFVWALVFLLCFQWDYSSVQHWLLPILAVRELPFQTLYSIRRLWNSCLATRDYPPTKTKTHTNVGSISKRKAVLWQNTANVKLFPPTCISKSWNKTII